MATMTEPVTLPAALHRRNGALLAPPHPARSRHGGAAEAEGGEGAVRRARAAWVRRWRFYLAAAGIGTLGLVDFDVVDSSNLQRQIIHSTKDVGRSKIVSATEKLVALNPFLNVVQHETMLTSQNALEIISQYDVVADGTDNFPTRYLVNDACVLTGKPNAYGSIFRFEGQASVFATEAGPLLPLPLSRAAAAGTGALVRRRRRAGHPARTGGRDPGDRSDQADPRQRRAAHRPLAAGELPRYEVS